MKRDVLNKRKRLWRQSKQRTIHNRVCVFPLVIILWIGIAIGCVSFVFIANDDRIVSLFARSSHTDIGWNSVLGLSFWWLVMLAILFLCGMSAFGWPLIWLCVGLVGFRMGLIQCLCIQEVGWVKAAIGTCLPSLCYAAFVIALGRCSLSLSSVLAKELLPYSGGLACGWRQYKHCILCLFIGVVGVLLTASAEMLLMHYSGM